MLRLLAAICVSLTVILSPVIGASVMYIVDDDGFAKYKTIGEAINESGDGDTIFIMTGTYNERIILDKKLSLKPLVGEKGPFLLDGGGNETGITVLADGCVIEGLTITNYTGPGLFINSNNNSVKNNVFEDNDIGIFIENSSYNSIAGNLVNRSQYFGIVLLDASQNAIQDNMAENCTLVGILLNNSLRNSLAGNLEKGCEGGVVLEFSSGGNTIADNQAESCSLVGTYLKSVNGNSITNSTARSCTRGIFLMNSSENLIHDNLVSECEFGIRLEDNCSDNEISGCKLEIVTTALALLNSASGNRIYENNIRGATDGVAIISSESNMLSFNQIMSCDSGIIIGDSSRNVLEDNNQTDVLFGLTVDGALPESFDNSIALSNTIDGRPILYCYDQSEVDILGGEYAHLTLAKCNNCKVEGNTITNDALLLYVSENNSIEKNNITGCYGGIRLQDSRGNKIRENYVCFNMFSGAFLVTSDFNQISENAFDDNKNGIYLVNSSGNLIGDNTINRNKETGILLSNSSLNIVSSNTVDLNEIGGIHLTTSDANEIFNNTVSNSPTGIEITGSTENKIYNNNLAANGVQAVDDTGNIWDLGATEGGNFWSDHECSGNPSAGQPKAIGDLAVDSYPFQDIFGWILPKPT